MTPSTSGEIKEIRREVRNLRRDFEAWNTAKPRRKRTRPAERGRFADRFRTAIADQLQRQREFISIERRLSELEGRLTALEKQTQDRTRIRQ